MNEDRKNHSANKLNNKTFGFVMALFFLIVAIQPMLTLKRPHIWALIFSGIFLLVTLLNSSLLTPLNFYWHQLGLFLHKIVSPVLLAIVFYIVITPFGFLLRSLNKNFFKLRPDSNIKSYWIDRDLISDKQNSMKNQF